MLLNKESLPFFLERLLQGEHLQDIEAEALMKAWLNEELSDVQTGAVLTALRANGISGDELASMAKVLRAACPLPCDKPSIPMVDTCGTGGDGAETFNISTAVAFTISACGLNVAKHGNRSASGKVGSADVLECMGLKLKAPLEQVVAAINEVGITFLFAPAWHPALVKLAPLRKSLGIRTVFNLLGPLVNPLSPESQVLGVASADLLDPMANAIKKLGLKRGIVVHGAGGLDEASLEGENALKLINDGVINDCSLTPEDLGLSRYSIDKLKGGSIQFNSEILCSVLKGKASVPQMDVVAFNSALALWVSSGKDDFTANVNTVREVMAEGLPWQKFEQLKSFLE